MTLSKHLSLCISLWLGFCAPSGWAQSVPDPVPVQDTALVQRVFKRLLTSVKKPKAYSVWPPTVQVVASPDINAYSKSDPDDQGRLHPMVVVYQGLLSQVIEKQQDRLAFILGHELGHIVLGHTLPQYAPDRNSALVKAVISRDMEFAADKRGVEIALSAGYSFPGFRKAMQVCIDRGLEYSGIEGLVVDHPAWSDRLTRLDPQNIGFWHAMSAFNDGVALLSTEQYEPAEACFLSVISAFPDSYEAWGDLGYARLMRYCDKLDASDVKKANIGYLVCGAFFRRIESQHIQKGVDAELWNKAVSALQNALEKCPKDTRGASSQALIKANLGLAYLVSAPDGSQGGSSPDTNRATATRYLRESAEIAAGDKDLDPLTKAAILVNTGVAQIQGGQADAGLKSMVQGEKWTLRFAGFRGGTSYTYALTCALLYNRGMVNVAASDTASRRKGTALLEQFLTHTNSTSLWWPIAYERYQAACDSLHLPAKGESALLRSVQPPRPVLAVDLGGGRTVRLAQDTSSLEASLGPAETVESGLGQGLTRLIYGSLGLELLANEAVLAVRLKGGTQVPIYQSGVGAVKLFTLQPGQKLADVQKALGPEDETVNIDDPHIRYHYYRNLGVALRVNGGVVQEIVIVQVPAPSQF